MTVAGYTDVQLDIFSGLSTDYSAPDLPPGSSPDCADVIFELAGAVRTRPGLVSKMSVFSGSVNYEKTYSPIPGTNKTLLLDSSGQLWQETANGVASIIQSGFVPNSYAKSTTQFGKEYIAISDGKFGVDLPYQFDGTFLDRISQQGPGAPPQAVADILTRVNVTSVTLSNLATIATITEAAGGTLVTVTTTAPHGLTAPGGFILIFGVVTSVGFNGIFQIDTIVSTTVFTVVNAGTGIAGDNTGNVGLALVTVVTGTPHGLNVGDFFTLTGNAGTLNNGQDTTSHVNTPNVWQVVKVDSATQFEFVPVGLNTTNILGGAGGTIQSGGRISPGTHSISVSFVTRQGYRTRPSPFLQWTATGNKQATITGIPIGPSNIVARIILISLVGQQTFFYVPTNGTIPGNSLFFNGGLAPQTVINSTVIPDNTTTSFTIDLSDTDIASFGISGQQLFTSFELAECAGFAAYNDRIVAWGMRNKVSNFQNTSWLGGVYPGALNQPLAWSNIVGNVAGATLVTGPAKFLLAYKILGDGATAVVGKITQSAYKDFLQIPILAINTVYSVRVWLMQVGNPGPGRFNVNLQSTSQAFTTIGLQVTAGQAPTTKFQEFNVQLTTSLASAWNAFQVYETGELASFNNVNYTSLSDGNIGNQPDITPGSWRSIGPVSLAAIPSDLLLQVYVDQTCANNAGWIVGGIQVYPTNEPFLDSQLSISLSEDPENFDGVTGAMLFSPNDGQRITCVLPVRERLRVFKYGAGASSYSTSDTGSSEPSGVNGWAINIDSLVKGAVSINGAALGEDWFLTADRSGLHISDGGEPMKVSQEIQAIASGSNVTSFWDNINWQFGHTIWMTVDIRNKHAYIGVPIGEVNHPNRIFVFDYRGLDSVSLIANSPSVHQSAYSGKTFTVAKGRRWVPWFITANSGALVERFDGTQQLFIGNGVSNNKVYQLTEGQFSDDGVAINSYYTTYAFLDEDQEVQLQLGGHLKLFAYLVGFAEGSGTFTIQGLINSLLATPSPIPTIALSNPASFDFERNLNIERASRCFFKFGTNAVGAWFRLERFTPSVGRSMSGVRGVV